ncbi:hypothetical protein [Bacteriophage sp.]|nr:hypothetical protein [Bacteriophage sp.]
MWISPAYVPVSVPARHACSHSASVGRRGDRPALRFPRRARNLCTSSQHTRSTGRSAVWNPLGFVPITASHNACVTGTSPSQYPRVSVTKCRGPSSSQRPSSPSGDPIQKRPGGIHRNLTRTPETSTSAHLPYSSMPVDSNHCNVMLSPWCIALSTSVDSVATPALSPGVGSQGDTLRFVGVFARQLGGHRAAERLNDVRQHLPVSGLRRPELQKLGHPRTLLQRCDPPEGALSVTGQPIQRRPSGLQHCQGMLGLPGVVSVTNRLCDVGVIHLVFCLYGRNPGRRRSANFYCYFLFEIIDPPPEAAGGRDAGIGRPEPADVEALLYLDLGEVLGHLAERALGEVDPGEVRRPAALDQALGLDLGPGLDRRPGPPVPQVVGDPIRRPPPFGRAEPDHVAPLAGPRGPVGGALRAERQLRGVRLRFGRDLPCLLADQQVRPVVVVIHTDSSPARGRGTIGRPPRAAVVGLTLGARGSTARRAPRNHTSTDPSATMQSSQSQTRTQSRSLCLYCPDRRASRRASRSARRRAPSELRARRATSVCVGHAHGPHADGGPSKTVYVYIICHLLLGCCNEPPPTTRAPSAPRRPAVRRPRACSSARGKRATPRRRSRRRLRRTLRCSRSLAGPAPRA